MDEFFPGILESWNPGTLELEELIWITTLKIFR
jgi:hypothetical protein